MFDEDKDSILERINELMELDATACRMLSLATLLIKDDESAVQLLARVREHIRITDDTDRMFETNYYLDYISDLLDILNAIETNGPLPKVRDTVRDHYETLLYNRELLMSSLNTMQREIALDNLRDNYWKN